MIAAQAPAVDTGIGGAQQARAALIQEEGFPPSVHVRNRFGSVQVSLDGARLTSWIPHGGREVLWMSEPRGDAPRHTVRGGIPICFPWFGHLDTDPRRKHGYAGESAWDVLSLGAEGEEEGEGERTTLVLALPASILRAEGMAAIDVTYRVQLGKTLRLSLEVANGSRRAVSFEAVLHAYYAATSLDRLRLVAHDGENLLPAVAPGELLSEIRHRQLAARLSAADGSASLTMRSGAPGYVLWNPGTRVPDDIAPSAWERFLCVEPGSFGRNTVTLAPGDRHATWLELDHAPRTREARA